MAHPSSRTQLVEILARIPDQDLPAAQAFLEFLAVRATVRAALADPTASGAPLDTATAGAYQAVPIDASELLARLRDAPLDDEPLTADDIAALVEAYADLARGAVVTEAALRRELGIPG